MGRKLEVNVSDGIIARQELIIGSTDGKTNRSLIHSDSINPTDTLKLNKYIIGYVEESSFELDLFIEQLIKNFETILTLDKSTFYRGLDSLKKKQLATSTIGPPDNPKHGRYNVEGEICLYLTDNFNFLFSEISAKSVLVQKYRIPINNLKIADLSPNNKALHNSLALAFQMTERGNTSSGYDIKQELEKRGKNEYLVSQLLASHFKKYNWDGMYIPGVHGATGVHYHNLVLFSLITKNNKWKPWTVGIPFEIQNI